MPAPACPCLLAFLFSSSSFPSPLTCLSLMCLPCSRLHTCFIYLEYLEMRCQDFSNGGVAWVSRTVISSSATGYLGSSYHVALSFCCVHLWYRGSWFTRGRCSVPLKWSLVFSKMYGSRVDMCAVFSAEALQSSVQSLLS